MSDVQVFARFRPMVGRELKVGATPCYQLRDNTVSIDKRKFTFDQILDSDTSQAELYATVAQPMVQQVLSGFNATIMAYGQTGAGKTFSMMGAPESSENAGIIPRIVSDLFAHMDNQTGEVEYLVECSFVEIYMEKVCDLLNKQKQNLKLRELSVRSKTKSTGYESVYIEDVTKCSVRNVSDIMKVMRKGQRHRKVASTSMNKRSSRSHSVFILSVVQTQLATQTRKSSQLFLVDLAGSENVGRSQVAGLSLEQAAQINKSLSALSMVIRALVEKQKHVPYRNSKLTRLLTHSLGGNSKTVLLLALSPASDSLRETVSTLKFGSRAKLVENKAKVNQDVSVAQYRRMVAEYKRTIESLQAEMANHHDQASAEANEQIMALHQRCADLEQENLVLKQRSGRHSRTNSAISEAHSVAHVIENVQEVFGPEDVVEVTVKPAADELPNSSEFPLSPEEKTALDTMHEMIEAEEAQVSRDVPPGLDRRPSLEDLHMFQQTGNLVVWGEDTVFAFEDC